MKRLVRGLAVGGGVALLVAVIIGFVPTSWGNCTGSYFVPMSGDRKPDANGHISLANLCRENGYPELFWTFILIGALLLIAAIVVQQIAAHRASLPPSSPKPARATVVVAAAPVPTPTRAPAPPRASAPASNTFAQVSIAEELKLLSDLHDSGGLTDHEYAAAKKRVIGGSGPA
jgi:hypothetical protein